MLIRITNACHMGCKHCGADTTPAGPHMTRETFTRALAFTSLVDPPLVMISGGEPSEHPTLLDFLDMTKAAGMKPLLISNGMFLANAVLREQILDRQVPVQVTCDPRFYPIQIPRPEHPLLTYEDHIQQVAPFGRAVTNRLACNRTSPLCFNLRSATRQLQSFQSAVRTLRAHNKFCTPSINWDGTVVAGEWPSCAPIGTVSDSLDTFTDNLLRLRCRRCGLIDKIPTEYRRAVGEA